MSEAKLITVTFYEFPVVFTVSCCVGNLESKMVENVLYHAEYTTNIFRGFYIIISPMVIERYLALEKKSMRILYTTFGKIKLTTGGNFVVLNVHVKGYFVVLNVHVKGAIL